MTDTINHLKLETAEKVTNNLGMLFKRKNIEIDFKKAGFLR